VIFLLNIFLFFKYEKISKIFNLLDTNNNNKILKINGYPVGGVILFVNIFILFLANYFFNVDIFNIRGEQLFFFFITCLFLFLLGVCDDKFNLSPYQKFLFLFLIFYFLIFFDNSIQIVELRFDVISYTVNLGLFSKFFTILFLLMFLNAFNMFDGINLQSGLYSFLVIFVFLIFIKKINIYYFILLFLIIFLYWNCRKNVLLGNSGSLLIPFIISYYFIKFYNDNTIAFVDEIYIYMCIPGLDMFRLFVNRIIKKKILFVEIFSISIT